MTNHAQDNDYPAKLRDVREIADLIVALCDVISGQKTLIGPAEKIEIIRHHAAKIAIQGHAKEND